MRENLDVRKEGRWGSSANALENGSRWIGRGESNDRIRNREDWRLKPWWSYRIRHSIVVDASLASRVVETVRMPTIVVAVVVVHADGARLAISC